MLCRRSSGSVKNFFVFILIRFYFIGIFALSIQFFAFTQTTAIVADFITYSTYAIDVLEATYALYKHNFFYLFTKFNSLFYFLFTSLSFIRFVTTITISQLCHNNAINLNFIHFFRLRIHAYVFHCDFTCLNELTFAKDNATFFHKNAIKSNNT